MKFINKKNNRDSFVQITNAHNSSKKQSRKLPLLLELELSTKIVKQVSNNWHSIFKQCGLSDQGIAACKPTHFRNGILTIACDTPLILNHIRMHEKRILDACNQVCRGSISKLRIAAKDKAISKHIPVLNQYDNAPKFNQILRSNAHVLKSTVKSMSDGPLKDSLERLIITANKAIADKK